MTDSGDYFEYLDDTLEDWLFDWLRRHKFRPIHLLGAGAAGYAFLLESGKVVKISWDPGEEVCVRWIIDNTAWLKTKHLPEIFAMGAVEDIPVEIVEAASPLPGYEPIWYMREYLEPASNVLSSYIPDEEYEAQWQELGSALGHLGIALNDPSSNNVGYRPDDFTTLVVLDVDCSRI